MQAKKFLIAACILGLIAAFFAFDLGHYFTLDYFKAQQAAINDYYSAHALQTAAIFLEIRLWRSVTGITQYACAPLRSNPKQFRKQTSPSSISA